MDISGIDINFIEIFDLSYTVAEAVFDTKPDTAPANVQKKIRKWIDKTYISDASYPARVMQFVGKDVSDADLIAFTKACHDHIKANGTGKKQLFDKFSADLSAEVKEAIWAILERDNTAKIMKCGEDAKIIIENHVGFYRTLMLLGASCLPEGKFDYLSFENGSLIKPDGEYRLIGTTVNWEDDTEIPFAIRFADAKVEVSVFRADEQTFLRSPWEHLQCIINLIFEKYSLPGDHLNDREKELLPLVSELTKLAYFAHIPEELDHDGFPVMREYIKNHGFDELLPLFDILENDTADSKKKFNVGQKIIAKLNTVKYEPLWRELYELIVSSQANYPSMAEALCPSELLKETRENIQTLMESHGYSGTYPNFSKRGSLKGVRLIDSYDMSYFIVNEKDTVHHIHCTEEYVSGYLNIEFLCGAQMLRKNETSGDIYSCLFNAKGRRVFSTVSYESEHTDLDGNIVSEDLERRVLLATKRAELKKLTKEEREEITGFEISYFKMFLLVLLLMGIPFGIFMTLGMMAIAVITCLVAGQPETIPSMFTDIPWWALFLLTFGLFGGAMGVVTVLSKSK